MAISPRRAAALTASAVALVAAAVIPLAGSAASATAHHAPPHRQLGVTTLTNFRVVLTATQASRTSAPSATVTAAGYRHTAHGWQLISVQRIGRPGGWSWFATQVCSLRTAQFRPQPSTATPADSITVKLLWGPAIGCLGPYTRTWKP
jgi:hypothetical protein